MYKRTLTNLCTYLKNWFYTNKSLKGTITIENGNITNLDFISKIQRDQYFRVTGSVFNDGVYQYDGNNLCMTDEEFVGVLHLMAIPQEVQRLATDIETWTEQNKETLDSPFQSESFGGYSYTKSSGASGGGWEEHFANRLNQWRKI